ncbi:hypothetical protein O3M35_009138 [Rhynocoris fuscipes]|uniref:Uncharacterized protein n=1 Tax=Rhynocoris fuscipes TaxID=488301 RepID=A0AAW1D9E7_9HEMI
MDECPKPVRTSRKTSRGTTESLACKYDPRRTSNEEESKFTSILLCLVFSYILRSYLVYLSRFKRDFHISRSYISLAVVL